MSSPKKNVAYEFDIALIDSADTGSFKVNPTIAAGDFKVSIDNGAFANLATLPVVSPAGGILVKINLSAAEMNGDKINIQVIDAAGAEWDDVLIFIDATTVNVDDLNLDTAIAELAQAAPAATPSMKTALMALYMALRNKIDVTATTKEIHNDAGTVIFKKTLSDDGTTVSEAEAISGP